MKLYSAIAAQQPAPAVSDPTLVGSGIEQYGLLGVLAFFVVKEAAVWFRKKDQAEEYLITTLVEDLRCTQKELLEKLFTLHSQQHEDLRAVQQELEELNEKMERLVERERPRPELRQGLL